MGYYISAVYLSEVDAFFVTAIVMPRLSNRVHTQLREVDAIPIQTHWLFTHIAHNYPLDRRSNSSFVFL